MQKHYSHRTGYINMGKNGEILHAAKWQWKQANFKFMFKCRQCHWWHHLLYM